MGSLVTSKTIARSERPFPTEKKIDSYMINHNHQHYFKFMVVNKPTTNKETIRRGTHQQSSIQWASNNSTTRTTTTHVAIDDASTCSQSVVSINIQTSVDDTWISTNYNLYSKSTGRNWLEYWYFHQLRHISKKTKQKYTNKHHIKKQYRTMYISILKYQVLLIINWFDCESHLL